MLQFLIDIWNKYEYDVVYTHDCAQALRPVFGSCLLYVFLESWSLLFSLLQNCNNIRVFLISCCLGRYFQLYFKFTRVLWKLRDLEHVFNECFVCLKAHENPAHVCLRKPSIVFHNLLPPPFIRGMRKKSRERFFDPSLAFSNREKDPAPIFGLTPARSGRPRGSSRRRPRRDSWTCRICSRGTLAGTWGRSPSPCSNPAPVGKIAPKPRNRRSD